jgi:hypothetical protein
VRTRSSIIGGAILISAGIILLLLQLLPNTSQAINIEQQWPLIIAGVGLFLILGAFLGAPPLAVPGSVVAGIGLTLYFQNVYDAWETWAFSWALIPTFVGIGTILMRALQGNVKGGLRDGGRLIVLGIVLFFIFGAVFSGWLSLEVIWPMLVIALGLWLLIRSFLRRA